MQQVSVSGGYSHLPLSEDPNKASHSNGGPSDEQLRNMPAPSRINGLQWNLASPQERRTLLAAEIDQEPTKNNASPHSFSGFESVAAVFALLHSPPAFSTDGWDKEQHGDNFVYNPSDLDKDKLFRVTAFPPARVVEQDLEAWFLSEITTLQKSLGQPLKDWKIAPEKNAELGTNGNTFLNAKGEKVSVGYQLSRTEDGKACVLQILSSQDLGIEPLIKYGLQVSQIARDSEDTFGGKQTSGNATPLPGIGIDSHIINHDDKSETNSPKPSRKEMRLEIETAIRMPPGQGAKLSEIETVWVDSGLNLILGGFDVDTYVLFKDGSVYLDCDIPPTELNVSASRQQQVAGDVYKYGKWSEWRRSGFDYQIKSIRTGVWESLEGSAAIPAAKGETLNGKYLSAGGSQFFGSWKNWITFKPDGRFELNRFSMQGNDALTGADRSVGPSITSVHQSNKEGTSSAVAVSGDNIGGGSSLTKKDGSKNTGTYSLDGHTITLKHDNGFEHTELFYFDKPDKKSLIYQDNKYWV